MRGEPTRGLVLARALTLAVPSLALSALAHVLGGGMAAPATLAALGVLQLALATGVARRPLGVTRVTVWAVAAQTTTHLALTWLHPSAGTVVTITGHHAAGHVAERGRAALGHTHALVPGGTARWAMLAAHVVGTLVLVALLSGIDRAAAAVRSRWAVVLEALAGIALPVPPRGPAPTPTPATGAGRLLRHSAPRRGPPAVAPA